MDMKTCHGEHGGAGEGEGIGALGKQEKMKKVG